MQACCSKARQRRHAEKAGRFTRCAEAKESPEEIQTPSSHEAVAYDESASDFAEMALRATTAEQASSDERARYAARSARAASSYAASGESVAESRFTAAILARAARLFHMPDAARRLSPLPSPSSVMSPAA